MAGGAFPGALPHPRIPHNGYPHMYARAQSAAHSHTYNYTLRWTPAVEGGAKPQRPSCSGTLRPNPDQKRYQGKGRMGIPFDSLPQLWDCDLIIFLPILKLRRYWLLVLFGSFFSNSSYAASHFQGLSFSFSQLFLIIVIFGGINENIPLKNLLTIGLFKFWLVACE